MAFTPASATRASYTRYGYGVGIAEYLDTVENRVGRYWRAIEYGSDAWVGQPIAGLWGNSFGPRPGLWPTATAGFGGADEQFIPFFSHKGQDMFQASRLAYWYWVKVLGHRRLGIDYQRSHHGSGKAAGWFQDIATRGTVNLPIEPHRYFEKALEAFDPGAEEMNAIAQAFTWLGPAAGGKASAINKELAQALRRPAKKTPRARTMTPSKFTSGLRGAGVSLSIGLAVSAGTQSFGTDFRGRYTDFQRELVQINRRLAIELQERVVEAARTSIRRPGVTSGRLMEALGSPQNRYPQ